jgi:hypothetical protein
MTCDFILAICLTEKSNFDRAIARHNCLRNVDVCGMFRYLQHAMDICVMMQALTHVI